MHRTCRLAAALQQRRLLHTRGVALPQTSTIRTLLRGQQHRRMMHLSITSASSATSSTPAPTASADTPAPDAVDESNQCWKCNVDLEVDTSKFFCPGQVCGILQSAQFTKRHANYFELLEVPYRYDLDVDGQLRNKFRRLAQVLHPDRFASKSAQEELFARHHAVQINEAYSTLRCPVARAGYMLKLYGVAFGEEGVTMPDCELLARVMDIRETMAECDGDVGVLKELLATCTAEMATMEAALAVDFSPPAPDTAPTSAALDDAVQHATSLKYFQRLVEDLRQLLPAQQEKN